ncbi:MAG TPA: antibiotic biosynthesis monooxygenase [Terriglobales bacterium]|jgi:heme-degrading monooxygenase HmoA|nr:antibiotic biosynthesis monooxygenase [Terriglobales bacterium]
MHIIIWEFAVKEKHIREFISAYRSNGDWATLFRRAQGYLGTELLRSSRESNIFLTVDRWESATYFEIFQERFGAEYKKLDAQLEGYTSTEKKVGVFSEA